MSAYWEDHELEACWRCCPASLGVLALDLSSSPVAYEAAAELCQATDVLPLLLVQTPFFMQKQAMSECAQLAQFDEELYKVTGAAWISTSAGTSTWSLLLRIGGA